MLPLAFFLFLVCFFFLQLWQLQWHIQHPPAARSKTTIQKGICAVTCWGPTWSGHISLNLGSDEVPWVFPCHYILFGDAPSLPALLQSGQKEGCQPQTPAWGNRHAFAQNVPVFPSAWEHPPLSIEGLVPRACSSLQSCNKGAKKAHLNATPAWKKKGFGFTLPEGNTVLLSKPQIALRKRRDL